MCLTLACIVALSACTLPRGVGMTNEIIGHGQSNNKDAPFEIVRVKRDNVVALDAWPTTGWSGTYHWLPKTTGSNAPLIQTGDMITLKVWDNSENSLLTNADQKVVPISKVTVAPDGTIFVPYVGDIMVRGMRPNTARKKVEDALQPFIPSAQVQLDYEPGESSSVDLVSGVAKPGTYPLLDRNSTVLSIIARGGGISPTLNNPLVRLMRNGRTYDIRSKKLFSDARYDTTVSGGDKVVVQEDQRYFTAFGASGKENIVTFPKETLTALEAMSLVGGLDDTRANPKGVLVLREYTPDQLRQDGKGPNRADVAFVFDLTSGEGLFAARKFEINPQDTVIVTESPVVSVRTVFGLLNTLLITGNRLK
ncbi:polysaccharide biosynthesis/export family protein [Thioclava dalianensis]|uniref:polysaccharide biosynthesis/export family protein n=2 Tax=Thioclava dalianensis TaxID=1185766 RepID=UPI00068F86EF|nr:polysaccharide biosynthesis/export family protein [Thioclava dalianensis]